jgi:putative ABC transport system permease protein
MEIEIIKYSIKNLWSRKSRSFLTILSIFIGICAIFIFASFGLGLYNYVDEIAQEAGIDTFLVQAKGMGAPGLNDRFKITDKDLKVVEDVRGVKSATGMYMKAIEVTQNKDRVYTYLVGYKNDNQGIELINSLFNVGIINGRELEKNDRGKVVLGYSYQFENKILPKPYELNQKIELNGKKYQIIGFYDEIGTPQDDATIYMLEDDMSKLFPEDLSYGFLIGKVEDAQKIDSITDEIERKLRRSRGLEEGKEDFTVTTFEEQLEMFSMVLNSIIGFIFLIVIISAIVASINTANTMVTSVLERVKEIGIMKAIGATNYKIREIFLLESSILGFISGIIGVLLGWLLSLLGGKILKDLGWGFLSPDFHPLLFIICILISTIVGTLSGLIPSINASKQKPVDALRSE